MDGMLTEGPAKQLVTPERLVRMLASHLLRSNAEHGVEDAAEPV